MLYCMYFTYILNTLRMFDCLFAGHIYDVSRNYDVPFILAGTLGLVAGITVLILSMVMRTQRRHQHHA